MTVGFEVDSDIEVSCGVMEVLDTCRDAADFDPSLGY